MMVQEIPAVYMRGGTSRALIFHRRDLPEAGREDGYAAWTPLFLRAMGSPDPSGRQLNGIGGGISSLSKVAVIGPPTRTDADVDYLFGQVGIATATVGYRGNCGNISSAVGPFAVDEGLVPAIGDSATVRIHNINTGKIIRANFALSGARVAVEGDFELPGVAGSGSPIRLDFLDPAGSATDRLLPSGELCESLALEDGTEVKVSMVDAGNPVCFVAAVSFGLSGREDPAQISTDAALMARLKALREAAAVRMGLVNAPEEARTRLPNLPLVCLLGRPDPARYSEEAEADLVVRMISADQPHKATPLTGALCLAAAMGLEGSVASDLLARPIDREAVRIRHPAGVLPLVVDAKGGEIRSVSAWRTARRIMKGMVNCA